MNIRHYFLSLICILIIVLAGCGKKEQIDFSQYITAYTNGVIKSGSPISIYLGTSPTKGYQAGSALPDGILKISPSVKGQTTLTQDNCVEFIPAEPFKNGQTYKVVFKLGDLCDVPKEFREFEFGFQIIPLKTMFREGFLEAGQSDSVLNYRGLLVSSDQIDPEIVEKNVSAIYNRETLSPEWTHEGTNHSFVLKGLKKQEQSQPLRINYTKDIANRPEEETIEIPGLHDFTVLDVRANGEGEKPVILISMSEQVDPSQELSGMITVGAINSLNFKISGNTIYIYPSDNQESGVLDVRINSGIRSTNGNRLETEFVRSVSLKSTKPEVKLIGKGVIVPDENKVIIPFSAVGLKAVEVEIIQVLNQNMNFFLQSNSYDGRYELNRSARPVFRKKIELQKDHPEIDPDRWNDYTLDLGQLVKLEKGTVYQIQIMFRKSYTTLACASDGADSEFQSRDWDSENYYSTYWRPEGFEWEEQDNPCHVSYYNSDRFPSRNIINTSLGIMAKKGADNRYLVCVTDLATTDPVADCQLIFFNFQNQKIDSARTDKNGFAELRPTGRAFIIQAQKGKDKSWLKVGEGEALSLSNFDVSGQHVQMGVKGFTYGERGVWRPGDNIYLSLILEDKMKVLPDGHPIVAQLIDPKGNVVQSRKSAIGQNNIHCFMFRTDENAPTGYWNALFKVGGLTFRHSVRIETVKPNRLAINMNFPNEEIVGEGVSEVPVKVTTKWLNGARTSNQKAITEIRLNNGNGNFKEYPEYTFKDQSRYFEPTNETLFDGTTGSDGSYSFNVNKIKTENAPGILNATFTTRVFENGGDFSISSQNLRYSPYTEYVGIRLPESEDRWYPTGKKVLIQGITVSPSGQKTGNSTISINVYQLNWHWWWDSEDENMGSYVNREYKNSIISKTVKAQNGSFSTDIQVADFGRYFIQATDPSGHSTGIIAYFGGWNDAPGSEAATTLQLSTDKKSYKVGEKIKVRIPSSAGATAIISLESGKSISRMFRVPATAEYTNVEIEAESYMCPNIYIGVSLIQPYNKRDNDRPIRLYGVINVGVEDPSLVLHPEVKIGKELRPAQEFSVEVREKDGKEMNYTIAIVDEGLLSLTAFRTPDPFRAFYAREALGVKTWDFYDYIYGAYGARLDKAFAVGGDEAIKPGQDENTNRFKPVVIFAGPFSIGKGKSQTHHFQMPDYIGEVRTMVIAAYDGRYGSVSASSTVNKPLMISVAMPRMLTPGDEMDIPVTVFAMKDNIREATVTMSGDNKVTFSGNTTQTVHFSGKGEQVVYFRIKAGKQVGTTIIQAQATSGKEKSAVSQNITIRIPNPRITQIAKQEVKGGEKISFSTEVSGLEPVAVLEVTSIPPLNLEQRLDYLLSYPHGCAEQITSQAFPQLMLPALTELTKDQQKKAEDNIRDVISRLRTYQTTEGGFAYWPGSSYVSEWGTSYIVDFLISAQKKGYSVPAQMLGNAQNYMKQSANKAECKDSYTQLQQAYRLYVLALGNKANLAAMNRLKESAVNSITSRWLLAAAYNLCNQEQVAQRMVQNISSDIPSYRETGGNYGSETRDNSLILLSMVTLNMQQDAYRMLEKISRSMGSSGWYSTQETAFALIAASQYVEKFLGTQQGVDITVNGNGDKINVKTQKTVWQQPLKLKNGAATTEIKNNGKGNLYARIISSSAPLEAVREKTMSGLNMSVTYYNAANQPIDISKIKHSTDVTAEITIRNTGVTGTYNELALTYMVPSGFEIINDRLTGNNTANDKADYTDIRDDRFYVYFSLEQGKSKTFRFRCNAAFKGDYLQPAITCSAMYDNAIQAILPGGRIQIQ